MPDVKQIIIMRTDLNMRKDKMIEQGCHASMKIFFDKMMQDKIGSSEFDITIGYRLFVDDNTKEWIEGSFPKVVVGVNTLEDLTYLKGRADEAEIQNALIIDKGLTEFKQKCSWCGGSGSQTSAPSSNTAIPSTYECYYCKGTGKENKPTITCLAIGPDLSEKIDKITGHLNLL